MMLAQGGQVAGLLARLSFVWVERVGSLSTFLKGTFRPSLDLVWDPLTLLLHYQHGEMKTKHVWLGVIRQLSGISMY